MLTEEEARGKWCPFARTLNGSACAAAVNRGMLTALAGERVRCIASECMAWRWSKVFEGGIKTTEYKRTPIPKEGHTINEPMGYCGLAGVPE